MEVAIDFKEITDWKSFHHSFKEAMGFPAFYGNNMNAWIDCMSYIDDPEAGMSSITVAPGESLEITAHGIEFAYQKCPDVLQAFLECTAAVNQRFIELKSRTRLKVVAT